MFFVPTLAEMLVFDDSFSFSIPHVPSRCNGYMEQVGGYHQILIGALNPPNASLLLRSVFVFDNSQPAEFYQSSLFLSPQWSLCARRYTETEKERAPPLHPPVFELVFKTVHGAMHGRICGTIHSTIHHYGRCLWPPPPQWGGHLRPPHSHGCHSGGWMVDGAIHGTTYGAANSFENRFEHRGVGVGAFLYLPNIGYEKKKSTTCALCWVTQITISASSIVCAPPTT